MATVLLNPLFESSFSMPLPAFNEEIRMNSGAYDKYKLIKITHYKEPTAVAHEFLCLEVFDGQHSITLRMERRPARRKAKTGSISAYLSPYTRITDDSISRDPTMIGADQGSIQKRQRLLKLLSLTCPTRVIITLPEICDVVRKMARRAPNYTLLSHQCYWFSITLTRGIEEHVKKVSGDKKGMIRREEKYYRDMGKFWKAVPIMDDEKAKRDMDEYDRQVKAEEDEAKAENYTKLRHAFITAVEQEKQERMRKASQALNAVAPHLQTSEERGKLERQAYKAMFAKITARKEGRK